MRGPLPATFLLLASFAMIRGVPSCPAERPVLGCSLSGGQAQFHPWSTAFPLFADHASPGLFNVTPGEIAPATPPRCGNGLSIEESFNVAVVVVNTVASREPKLDVAATERLAHGGALPSPSVDISHNFSNTVAGQSSLAVPLVRTTHSQAKDIVRIIFALGVFFDFMPSVLYSHLSFDRWLEAFVAILFAFFSVAAHENERIRRVRAGGTRFREHRHHLSSATASLTLFQGFVLLSSPPLSSLPRQFVAVEASPHFSFHQQLPLYRTAVPISGHISFPAHLAVPARIVALPPPEWFRSSGRRGDTAWNDLPPPYSATAR